MMCVCVPLFVLLVTVYIYTLFLFLRVRVLCLVLYDIVARFLLLLFKMYIQSWEEFAKQAERLYLNDPMGCRLCMKYQQDLLIVRLTDDRTCLQYKTKYAQDMKKVEKFMSSLLRHMASKET